MGISTYSVAFIYGNGEMDAKLLRLHPVDLCKEIFSIPDQPKGTTTQCYLF